MVEQQPERCHQSKHDEHAQHRTHSLDRRVTPVSVARPIELHLGTGSEEEQKHDERGAQPRDDPEPKGIRKRDAHRKHHTENGKTERPGRERPDDLRHERGAS